MSMNPNNNPWRVLGINPTTNKRQIKRAYANKLKIYHPEENPEEFQNVQQAYEIIMKSLEGDFQQHQSAFTIDLKQIKTDHIFEKELEEEKKKQVVETKASDFYIDLNLDESFTHLEQESALKASNQNQSEQDDGFYIQEQEQQEDDVTIEDLKRLYFQKFTDSLRFSVAFDQLLLLLNDPHIVSCLMDKQFYEQTVQLLKKEFERMDSVTLMYLSDYFRNLKDIYYFNEDVSNLSDIIATYFKERKQKQQWVARKQKSLFFIGWLLMVVIIIVSSISNQSQEKKEQDKFDEINDSIRETYDQKLEDQNSGPFIHDDDEQIKAILIQLNIINENGVDKMMLPSGNVYEMKKIESNVKGRIQILVQDDGKYYGLDIMSEAMYGPFDKLVAFNEPNTTIAHYYVVQREDKFAIFSDNMEQLSDFEYAIDTLKEADDYGIIKDVNEFRFFEKSLKDKVKDMTPIGSES